LTGINSGEPFRIATAAVLVEDDRRLEAPGFGRDSRSGVTARIWAKIAAAAVKVL
jgi:hypothetical protein